ncbi:MAG: hypothetical protein N2D54_00035, partial [Chloroflexota bacterium]
SQNIFSFVLKGLLVATLLVLVVGPAPAAQAGLGFSDCASADAAGDINETECDFLLAFYASTIGGSWTEGAIGDIDGWGWQDNSDPCLWWGITCNGKAVTKIVLNGNNLTGKIHEDVVTPTHTIDQLSSLEEFNVNSNSLTGGLPDEITNITSLKILKIVSNPSFGGTIPANIGNLTNLTDFWAGAAGLTGTIPSSISTMAGLEEIRLDGNNMTGPIPVSVTALPNLDSIIIPGNDFDGPIHPEFGDMPLLRTLNLGHNLLTGIIPANLGNATTLKYLYLDSNDLSGNLPPELGNLTQMLYFTVDDNPKLDWAVPISYASWNPIYIRFQDSNLCLPNAIAGGAWYDNIGDRNPDPFLDFCDPIFTDGFESGDTTAWSSAVGVSGLDPADYQSAAVDKLIVNNAASLIDQKGLKVRVVNKAVHYVQDTSPAAETRYHARFYIDINGLTMGKNHQFELFQGRKGTKKVFYLTVKKNSGKYWIRGSVRQDDGTYKNTIWTALPKTTKAVEIDYKAGAGNGFLKLYVNDTLKVKKLNVDNDTLSVKTVRLGITKKIKPAHTILGAFYLDQFGSDSSVHIGK